MYTFPSKLFTTKPLMHSLCEQITWNTCNGMDYCLKRRKQTNQSFYFESLVRNVFERSCISPRTIFQQIKSVCLDFLILISQQWREIKLVQVVSIQPIHLRVEAWPALQRLKDTGHYTLLLKIIDSLYIVQAIQSCW